MNAIQTICNLSSMLQSSKTTEWSDNPQVKSSLESIMGYLQLTNIRQVALFVATFERNVTSRWCDIDDLTRFFGISAMECMPLVVELEAMARLGHLQKQDADESITRTDFRIAGNIMDAIVCGEVVELISPVANSEFTRYTFCRKVSNWVENNNLSTSEVIANMLDLEKQHQDLVFVEKTTGQIQNLHARALFYEMCNDFVSVPRHRISDEGYSEIRCTMRDLFDDVHQRNLQTSLLRNKQHPLCLDHFIDVNVHDNVLHLTNKSKQLFLEDDYAAYAPNYYHLDRYKFAEAVHEYIHSNEARMALSEDGDREENVITHTICDIEDSNPQLSFIPSLRRILPDPRERALVYDVAYSLIYKGDGANLQDTAGCLYNIRDQRRLMNAMADDQHNLQRLGLAKIEKRSNFFGEATILSLTGKGCTLYFEEDAALYAPRMDGKNRIAATEIVEKPLFFANDLERQLSLVRNSLQDEAYRNLCTRLEEKRMPRGIAILLYGHPGTGKTESVMQIARATGRDVMHVDIAASKSMWFGESEKKIKEIFVHYREMCDNCERKPILLFNEADALFGKRKDTASGSCAQTENAIQNILLEEMERLDGILMATTNLTDNLDAAFERRFLFKVHFERPAAEAKARIWQSKLPSLTSAEAEQLAARFDFSGGEIDNIVRRATMRELIEGVAITPEVLDELCRNERLSTKSNSRHIGFA